MLVKTQHYLQPNAQEAHSVIIEDGRGNIIYVAVEVDGGQIITAQAGGPDFNEILKALGIDKTTNVYKVQAKSIDEMKSLL